MTLLEKIEIFKLTAWLMTNDISLSDMPGDDTFREIEICNLSAWLMTSDISISDIPGDYTFKKN
jgi:hypothetical protein